MMPSFQERLTDIESSAQSARLLGAMRRAEIYQEELDDISSPLWIDIEDLNFVATLLVGEVASLPNFCVQGERLAGGIRWKKQGVATIFYEAYDPAMRQRFSVAHELGHFFLHEDILMPQGGWHSDTGKPEIDENEIDGFEVVEEVHEYDSVLETEADAFAAAFLMPSLLVARDIEHFGLAVPFLTARYGVSRVALRKRLLTLRTLGLLSPNARQSASVAGTTTVEK